MKCYDTLDKPEILEFTSGRKIGFMGCLKGTINRLLGHSLESKIRYLGVPVRVDVNDDHDGYLLRQYYRNRPFDLKLVYAGSDFVLTDAKVVAMTRTSENHSYFYIRYQGVNT